ncbi:MAG: methyltransferase, TrmH family, group 3 [Clostridiales bacterium]|jgi:TrmH family RNA methyltransferase|nr:methyltransferase, TrmH family, group 3 [Clostridiales bacterium]
MISSITNSKIKQVIALQNKAKERNLTGYYVIEGFKMLSETTPEDIVTIFYTEESINEENRAHIMNQPHEVVTSSVMKEISETKAPQGIVSIVKQKKYCLDDYLNLDNPIFIILETLQDPGNLGTILRTSEGAGVTAVIMNKNCVDIYNPKTVRATMGSLLRMPFIYVEDLKGTIEKIKNKGIDVYAAHLKATKTYDDNDYTKGVAFIIGNEGNGISDEIAACATKYIKIPMKGKLESLNAAISAAILTYEANRQRRT